MSLSDATSENQTGRQTQTAVAALRASGLAVCKPDKGEKKPTYRGWPTRSLEPDDFAEGDLVGILGGPLSDCNMPGHALVIIDLDTQEAVKKADDFLPPTGMEEGKLGKPRDHRSYLVPLDSIPKWAWSTAEQGAPAAKKAKGHPGPFKKAFCRKDAEEDKENRILDFIGTGGQVVCPSPGANEREWVGGKRGEPAVVSFMVLWNAVNKLAVACGGEDRTPIEARQTTKNESPLKMYASRGVSPLDRAIAYLAKMPPAVSGQGGHDRTLEAARVVVYGFDLGRETGFSILDSHYNPRCVPPWSESELRHKCRDADTLPFGKSRGWLLHEQNGYHTSNGNGARPEADQNAEDKRPSILTNYRTEELTTDDGKTAKIKVGLSHAQIDADMQRVTKGWPKRVEDRLFVEEDHRILWINSADALFAWIARQLPDARDNAVRWVQGGDKVSHGEYSAYLRQIVERFEAVEIMPHEPRLPNCYYCHPKLEGGGGEAFARLIERFEPASLIDLDLIRALFLSAFWGGPPGQRPAWLIESENDDGKGGRGVGKSKLAQAVAKLVGGHIDARDNEDIDKLMTRLLSPAAMDRRIAFLDNVKTPRFSWADLEATITTDILSGRVLYVGEGRRPNTLTWLITLNQASLSRDMAQRTIPLRLKRPKHDPNWEADTWELIETTRWQIIGDIIAELRRPVKPLARYSRWSAWEQAVLAHVGEPADCQKVIEERQEAIDDDKAEADIVREVFMAELRRRGHNPETAAVWLSSVQVAGIVSQITGERTAAKRATSYLRRLGAPELRKSDYMGQRGWAWRGLKSDLSQPLADLNPEPFSNMKTSQWQP